MGAECRTGTPTGQTVLPAQPVLSSVEWECALTCSEAETEGLVGACHTVGALVTLCHLGDHGCSGWQRCDRGFSSVLLTVQKALERSFTHISALSPWLREPGCRVTAEV